MPRRQDRPAAIRSQQPFAPAAVLVSSLITGHRLLTTLFSRVCTLQHFLRRVRHTVSSMDLRELRFEIDDLYAEYVECLDDGHLERWPELFTDDCLYKIIPRDNFQRGLPLALM